ncbi:hypothetical protein [Vibrio sp.]|uniref:hypothetical protein n=1 Tax=Vibrio sp. TaxID=678 RepID=UPI003D11E046
MTDNILFDLLDAIFGNAEYSSSEESETWDNNSGYFEMGELDEMSEYNLELND